MTSPASGKTLPSRSAPALSVAFASDENYLDGLVGTLAGVALSARSGPIQAVVLDCGIHDASWSALEQTFLKSFPHVAFLRLRICPEQLRVFNPANGATRLNNSSYARLLLPELLPDRDRILYLDCDLLVDADIGPLFATPLEGALAAAVADHHIPLLGQTIGPEFISPSESTQRGFNAGVLLMDLGAFRQADVIKQIISLPPSFPPEFQDQSILNYVLRGHWKALPTRWNRQHFMTENFSLYRTHPDSIWHFVGRMKPWHYDPAHMRGLVADFHRNLLASGWTPRLRGTRRPLSPAWRDLTKASRALALRHCPAFVRAAAL